MHNKLLVAIQKGSPEPFPVHEKSLKNKNDLCLVFEILNVVSTNHYACLCKISSCSGDRKLGFLKRKKLFLLTPISLRGGLSQLGVVLVLFNNHHCLNTLKK